MKVDTETLKVVLQRNELDVRKIAQILEDLAAEARENTEEHEPAVKKQFVVLVSDPENVLKDTELTGWVVQIADDESPFAALEKIHESAQEFNTTSRGLKMPLETVADAAEILSPKITKEHGLWIKTKDPVILVATDNTIPLPKVR